MNERIQYDPEICGGEACIKGTRIPVRVILSHLAAGDNYTTILKDFPRISEEDIRACLEHAAYLASGEALLV